MARKKKASKKKASKKKASRRRVVQEAVDVEQEVVRLEEIDLLRIGKLHAEIIGIIGRAKLLANEIAHIKQSAETEIAKKDVERREALAEAKQLQMEYDVLNLTIAKKHGIKDPKQMTIDPVSGVVRDLRST